MKLLDIQILLTVLQIQLKTCLNKQKNVNQIKHYHISKEKTIKHEDITVNINHLTNKYTEQTINSALIEYNDQIKNGSAFGELTQNTKRKINLMNISHRVTKLELVNKTLNINIETLDNNSGRKLNEILNSKTKFQCRTIEKPTNFIIISIDAINNKEEKL